MYQKLQPCKFYHSPTKKIFDAVIVQWKIGGVVDGNIIYTPIIKVEINGVLSTITVESPSCIIKQRSTT